ncbi:MAG TPA: 3'-5' exonuclease [Opitutaceae bacterium]|nr:3'-5' exonuclease [Opitutaceae bacterium]
MDFRIADTFTDSLARLTGDEQKAVKTTAFDLQMNPANPGMSFHKIDHSKDKNFWSVRAGSDIRLIVHKTSGGLLLCYADHHDKAYAWAERRRLETHPKTGAAQMVELRETVKEILVPKYVEAPVPTPVKKSRSEPLFAGFSDDELLGFGVPTGWLNDVRSATEETLLGLTEYLPSEAAEALLELATGGKPRAAETTAAPANPFDHPDAQRRFRIMANVDELMQALEYPWDKWTVFLHPEQRQMVERDYRGPARVAGSAGTGKTIVALHRAVHLAKDNPDSRVLLTTFSDTLASALHTKLKRLVGSQPQLADRIDVASLDTIAQRLHRSLVGPAKLISSEELKTAMLAASQSVTGHKFSLRFLLSEWDQVVDAWQLTTWDGYRDVARLGRKTRLPESQRKLLWSIMELVRANIAARGAVTAATLFTSTAVAIGKAKNPPFDFAVVDEAQDIGVPHLRFLSSFARREDALFFAGDLGQRIFQTPFSWKALGVDVRGRSRTLRVNYRTSHQIRTQADRLLAGEMTDVDGNKEDRRETVSVFNGPAPTIRTFETQPEESKHVGGWIRDRIADGLAPHEIAVFVRSTEQLVRAEAALREAKIDFKTLDERVDVSSGRAALCTMHLAKGLEFRAVAVMACDDEVVPLQARIESVGDTGDLQEVYDTERHLLYVACTRARDHLLITSTEPASEFLDDLRGK